MGQVDLEAPKAAVAYFAIKGRLTTHYVADSHLAIVGHVAEVTHTATENSALS